MKEYIYGKNTVKEALQTNNKIIKLFLTKNNDEFLKLDNNKKIDYKIVNKAVNKYKTDLEELGKGNTDITAAILEEDIAAIKQSYERLIATLEIQLEEYKKEHGVDE